MPKVKREERERETTKMFKYLQGGMRYIFEPVSAELFITFEPRAHLIRQKEHEKLIYSQV